MLRGEWDPVLDSLSVVKVVITLEDLFDIELQPEKLVRKGGYADVESGVTDISARLRGFWSEQHSEAVA